MEKTELSNFLKQVRKFEKTINNEQGIKIAVIGSCSIQYFVKILRFYLAEIGIQSTIYEGEYNGINMDVFNPNSELYRFAPEYVIILSYYKDIHEFPPLLANRSVVDMYLNRQKEYFMNLWKKLSEISNVQILQSNIVIPYERLFGNQEYQKIFTKNSFLSEVNQMFIQNRYSNVSIVDVNALSNNIGKYNWFDPKAYFLNKAALRLEYMPEFVQCFVRQINALRGGIKKCLVLDLDNTLWGGVVGDEGWENIQIDPNNAVGEAYREFQLYCYALHKRGVILAVCSKNEENIAKEVFEKNENMILRLDDISCFVANWENKADNLCKIAKELNIGIDSMVFFDDNSAERAIIKQYLPQVHVIDVPQDPALYILQMEKEQPFDWLQITKEDLDRTSSYNYNQQRQQLQESFVNYDEYLQALKMKGSISYVEKSDLIRFTQLINKSNQFNLRTIRYTESDIEQMIENENYRCLYAKLSDRYSNYGIISCVILKKERNVCFIDTWVMSCRVLKRGVENMMFEGIINAANEMGCTSLRAEYIATKKNHMVEDFYDKLGFTYMGTKEAGKSYKEYFMKTLKCELNYYIKEEKEDD